MAKTQPHRFYPHHLVRFLNLQGGQYGALELVALSDDVLELQLGGDFVRLTRKQAEEMLDGVQKFLALETHERHRRRERETREGEEEERERRGGVVETVAQEVLEHEPRPRPLAKPPAKRKRARPTPSVEG